ncbi:MAG: hypothetical protein MJY88_08455 [Bacteroidales bacterium]|nr:hypothetical protein [Bacteroidales bacterium]
MKKTTIIIAAALAAILMASSCQEKEPKAKPAFMVSLDQVESPAEGGSFKLDLTSGDLWMATSNDPWISVSPANGEESAQCVISIDSTVVSTPRSGIIRFKNCVTGDNKDVRVSQDGFGYNISLADKEVSIKHYDNFDSREFSVKVRTNVPFKVDIPTTAYSWLSCEVPEMTFDRGARPRDITVKFKWGVNSVPLERQVNVRFIPHDGYTVDSADDLMVFQAAAPEITIGHEGDSIVVLSIARSIGMMQEIVSAQPMRDWDNVTLWEDTDEGYTPEKKGRVKSATFTLFTTYESLPYEVQYLTEAEELTFFSNTNSFIHEFDLGEYVCSLKNLKKLTVSAYGIVSLPDSLANLSNLEYLDLSSNNFSELPSVLTPENFPKLKTLLLNTCQRGYILDLSNTTATKLGGFKGPFPRRLLEWENLEKLRLSVNYFEGEMPDMLDYEVKYTEEDCEEMNLPKTLVGTPKVLPNAKFFAFNLNRMYGNVPDWILYHPNLVDWEPYLLCYPQEGRASNGRAAFFNNVPTNMDYYWKFYEGYKEHVDIYLGD